MLSRVLVQGLNNLPDRPWREKRNGKGITEAWLAEQLQPYGIRPGPMRLGQVQARGYFEADFQEAFQRYMFRSDMEALRASLRARQASEKPNPPTPGVDAASPSACESGATRDGGNAAEVGEQKAEASDPQSESGGAPEDDAAAA